MYVRSYLVEPDVIPEVWVAIELDVTAIGRPLAFDVATKDVNDAMLNFLGDVRKIHVVPRTRGTFDLHLITVVLVKSLQALNQEEVDSKPWMR